MRRIERAFAGRTFALVVFLAVYGMLLAIVLVPRDSMGSPAHDALSGASPATVDAPPIPGR